MVARRPGPDNQIADCYPREKGAFVPARRLWNPCFPSGLGFRDEPVPNAPNRQ